MFTIKKATLADIEVIRTLAAQTFPATYQHILTPEQIDYMMDWMYSSESLRNRICFTCRRFTYSPTSKNTNSDGNCSSRL